MMRFRVDEKRLLPGFAFRVLNSSVCKPQIVGMAKRAVAQSSVNQGDVGRLLVPLLPDVETQGVIVDVLSEIEAKSAVHMRTRAFLNGLFRTLLHQLMTAQIRVHDLDLSALEEDGQPMEQCNGRRFRPSKKRPVLRHRPRRGRRDDKGDVNVETEERAL